MWRRSLTKVWNMFFTREQPEAGLKLGHMWCFKPGEPVTCWLGGYAALQVAVGNVETWKLQTFRAIFAHLLCMSALVAMFTFNDPAPPEPCDFTISASGGPLCLRRMISTFGTHKQMKPPGILKRGGPGMAGLKSLRMIPLDGPIFLVPANLNPLNCEDSKQILWCKRKSPQLWCGQKYNSETLVYFVAMADVCSGFSATFQTSEFQLFQNICLVLSPVFFFLPGSETKHWLIIFS